MEAFQHSGSDRTRIILFWVAMGNVAVTLISSSIHIVKFLGEGFSSPAALIFAAISVLHFLSSGMSIAVSFTGFDVFFIRTTIGASIFVLIVDIIAFTLRAVLDVAVTDWFRIMMFVLGGGWLVFTTVEIIVLAILQFQTSKWRKKLLLCIKDKCYLKKKLKGIAKAQQEMSQANVEQTMFRTGMAAQKQSVVVHEDLYAKMASLQSSMLDTMKEPLSAFAAKRFWAMPRRVNRARRFLGFLWPVDLVLMILFLFFFAPGIVNNSWMTVLSFFTLPHLFQWAWIRAVTGPVAGELPEPGITRPDSLMLSLTRVLVALSLVSDFGSAVVRTYGIFIAPVIPDAPGFIVFVGAPVSMVFAVLSTSVIYLFLLIGLLEQWQLQRLVKGLRKHQTSPKGLEVKRVAKEYHEFLWDPKSKLE